MYRNKTFSLIMPCYNERYGIKEILLNKAHFIDETIVIDSSNDDTGKIAAQLGATVITEKSRGYGRAYKKGFAYATKEIFICIDADCTYPYKEKDLKPLVDIFLDEDIDFLTASRFPLKFDPSVMPPIRIIGNTIMTFSGNLIFGTKLRDYLSGMWIFKREILPKFILECNGWSLSEEIKLEAIINKVKFKEVHIPYSARIGSATLIDFAYTQYKVGFINLMYFFKKRFFRTLFLKEDSRIRFMEKNL
jgi:glycosyltransferase involved in cell wall biosynthesis